MAHKLCHAFSFVRSLFAQPFPYRKYRVDHSLDCVKVAGGLCRLALHLVLQQIYIQSPMHTFYRPVMAHNGTQERSVCRQTAYIQTFSRVCFAVVFLTVSASYSIIVMFPPHFSLSAIISSPSYMLYVLVSILP